MDRIGRWIAVLLVVVLGGIALSDSVGQAQGDEKKEGVKAEYSFDGAETAKSCRLLERTIGGTKAQARVRPGIVNNTYFLTVKGKMPVLNMKVTLIPRTYVIQPDYWGIEVVGCVHGVVQPTIGDYVETIPLQGIRGKKGIEVIWAKGQTEKHDVPKTE